MLCHKQTQITNSDYNARESDKIENIEEILKRDRLSQNIRSIYNLFSPASHVKILFNEIGKRQTKGRLAKMEGKYQLLRAKLLRAKLERAKLVGAKWMRAKLVRAKLVRAKLAGAKLVRAKLVGAKVVQGPHTGEEMIRLKRNPLFWPMVRGRRGTNSQGQNQNQNKESR